jgi:hypothetical protein
VSSDGDYHRDCEECYGDYPRDWGGLHRQLYLQGIWGMVVERNNGAGSKSTVQYTVQYAFVEEYVGTSIE